MQTFSRVLKHTHSNIGVKHAEQSDWRQGRVNETPIHHPWREGRVLLVYVFSGVHYVVVFSSFILEGQTTQTTASISQYCACLLH